VVDAEPTKRQPTVEKAASVIATAPSAAVPLSDEALVNPGRRRAARGRGPAGAEPSGQAVIQTGATVADQFADPAPVPAPIAGAVARGAHLPATSYRLVPSAQQQAVDRDVIAANGLIHPEGNVGALAEEYRIIKRQLLRASTTLQHGRRVVVTSAQPDEGKTFSTINLALSLAAEKDVSVLLVDGDFARQDVPKKLGITPGPGLLDVLADPSIDLASCVIPTDIPRLSVLPSGNANDHETELLSSSRMADLLDQLDAAAPDRIILFDSMPLLAASSTGVVAQRCGQVLVVVRADVTREAALRDAIGLIGQHNGISLLLNRVRFTPEGRRFGSYYGEGG
jgi:exopolysaccharide/PEP-CTERM locus tyrosine autokinase